MNTKEATEKTLASFELLGRDYNKLKTELHKVIIGQDEAIDSVLCCMLAGGHCLLQGVPGLAKTLLVLSISEALDLSFNRIQFTPDLMPSDITGSEIITENRQAGVREFRFVPGPVFANVVLADEINRTPPKTQSALLQAMQEKKVSISGKTYQLDAPFFVMATQNPIEQEGTYPLPEAALDRFMFMIRIDYPEARDEEALVERTTCHAASKPAVVFDKAQMLAFQQLVLLLPVSGPVLKYCVSLARATRPLDPAATPMAKSYLKWGAGPRAGQFMVLGAKARALLQGRMTPAFEDVAYVARGVLRHRLVTNFNCDADGISVEDILDDLLERVRV
jgi:MoxR-like ATPase